MKVRNRIIPFGDYTAMAIWPFIFYKTDTLSPVTENHERIHHRQQREMLLLPFYLCYLVFHLIYGYYDNPFEREAYANDRDMGYLDKRRRWAWLGYIR